MKKLVLLATAALVAMLILVPTAMAQTDSDVVVERTVEMEATAPLPPSGGLTVGSPSVLLPVAVLLLGSGIVAYAFVRRT